MKAHRRPFLLAWLVLVAAAPIGLAQRDPHIGYLYPAGGRQGAEFQVAVGGQYLDGVNRIYVSGGGVQATVVAHTKPLTPKQLNELRERLAELQKQRAAARGADLAALDKEIAEIRKRVFNPRKQQNSQIGETVTLKVSLDRAAEPGPREIRLGAAAGISNPMLFHIGQLPEYCEQEPNDRAQEAKVQESLPVMLNGQILPGDVDRFRFKARQGERLVIAASARELVPYLADAVPGWFQATLTLFDAKGKELAFDDDFRFHPDPVLYYEIPEAGDYVLEIRDAIYRGREDFVYRIALGELPYLTSLYPRGGRAGTTTTVKLDGWNLPTDSLTLRLGHSGPANQAVAVHRGELISNQMPFAVDTLPEILEKEPNNQAQKAQKVKPGILLNGRVDQPGDRDVFRFEGRAGQEIVAEVLARRLDSPLDSVLRLTDAKGQELAANDDQEDKGAGLATHHADSGIRFTLPRKGTYYLQLADAQHQGGPAYSYRLRIGPPRPDFELRIVPSAINARPGVTLPLMVHALRHDGFSGEIGLTLKDPPPGFTLSGAWVPADQDRVRLTLTLPPSALQEPVRLSLEGRAVIQGREIRRQAVPAEDMMQAFIYRHLVPAREFLVAVSGPARGRLPIQVPSEKPLKIHAGGTTQMRLRAPRRPNLDQIQFELMEPPEGIAIESIAPVQDGFAVNVSADAAKIKAGLKGNLIVNAYGEPPAAAKAAKAKANRPRTLLATLPAIPFEIIPR